MSVSVNLADPIIVQEDLTVGVDGAEQPTIVHTAFNDQRQLDAASTTGGKASKVVVKVIALTAGAHTIDLTTITGTNGLLQNGTGLKVQIWRVKNLGANPMTFVQGASNGYLLKGSGWKSILAANQKDIFDGYGAAPDIDATHKEIDVTGTDDDSFELTLVMGED